MDVSREAETLISDRLMPGLCCLAWRSSGSYENGTATCVRISGRHYLISCAHVVEPFLRCHGKRKVLLGSGGELPEPPLRLVFFDRHHDVAVLRVLDPVGMTPLEESFLVRAAPSASELSANSLAFCGVPWALGDHTTSRSRFQPIVFLSEYLSGGLPRDRIACAYPTGLGAVTAIASLPHPGGISGSLLCTVPDMRLQRQQLWTLEDMRAVGIVTHFDSRLQQLEAVGLRHLPDWLGTEDDV